MRIEAVHTSVAEAGRRSRLPVPLSRTGLNHPPAGRSQHGHLERGQMSPAKLLLQNRRAPASETEVPPVGRGHVLGGDGVIVGGGRGGAKAVSEEAQIGAEAQASHADSRNHRRQRILRKLVQDRVNHKATSHTSAAKGTTQPAPAKHTRATGQPLFKTQPHEDDDEDEKNECQNDNDVNDTTAMPLLKRKKSVGKSARKKVLGKFRKAVHLIILAKRVIGRWGPPKMSQKDSILFFLDIPSQIGDQTRPNSQDPSHQRFASHGPHSFDVNSFKGLKDQTTTRAMTDVLGQAPSRRTDQQIETLQHMLQSYSVFAGYPNHVQRHICKYAWYDRYGPSRILVKQGQRANMYYLILSGVAISRSTNQEDSKDSRRNRSTFLRKGDAIGETEILKNLERESTVVTKEVTELLGLDREEFIASFQYIMGDGLDCLQFLKTIEVLNDFPLEMLQAHHMACSIQSYRRGAIIVKNSNDSEWVYIIQSGSCQVVKSVKSTPSSRRRQSRNHKKTHSDSEISSTQGRLPSLNNTNGNEPKESVSNAHAKRAFPSKRSISESHLPRIAHGGHLVSQSHSVSSDLDSITSTHSDDEVSSQRRGYGRRHRKPKRAESETDLDLDNTSQIGSHLIRLDTLTEKSVFGLQSLVFEDPPSVSLISNGVECVLISKRFLANYLDTTTLHKVMKKVSPPPSTSSIEKAVNNQMQWDSYKKTVVDNIPSKYSPLPTRQQILVENSTKFQQRPQKVLQSSPVNLSTPSHQQRPHKILQNSPVNLSSPSHQHRPQKVLQNSPVSISTPVHQQRLQKILQNSPVNMTPNHSRSSYLQQHRGKLSK